MKKKSKKKTLKIVLLSLAAIFLMAAIGISVIVIDFENRAGAMRRDVLPVLWAVAEAPEEDGIDADSEGSQELAEGESSESGSDEPAADRIVIDGDVYIGILEVPCIGLVLPVLNETSYPNLRKAPCRYTGSFEKDDVTVCGHNLPVHFGALKNVPAGAAVYFTDADGFRYCYEVTGTDVVGMYDTDTFFSGEWNLTLFTCKANRIERVAVRCKRTA